MFSLSQISPLYLSAPLLILRHRIASSPPSSSSTAAPLAPTFILLLVTLSPSPPSISGVLHKSSCHIDWLNEEEGGATVCSTHFSRLPTAILFLFLFSPLVLCSHPLSLFPSFHLFHSLFPPKSSALFSSSSIPLFGSLPLSMSKLFGLFPRSSGSFGRAAWWD